MNLHECLEQVARWYGISAGELIAYAAEDTLLGGVEGNPYGTSYAVDGHLLYALVRYTKPLRILEIGTDHGGSAKHMAAACKRNGKGHIWTIDIDPATGEGLSGEDRQWITQITADAALWILQAQYAPFNFIFEDGPHSEFICHVVYKHLPTLLTLGGFILSHDVSTWVGTAILSGIEKGGVHREHLHTVTPEPSPLGFSIYRFNEATYTRIK